MPENVGFIRVSPEDPNRCQAVHGDQQCPYRAQGTRRPDGTWDGFQFCIRHSGYARKAAEKADHRLYLTAKWKEQIGFQADHPRLRSLNEEIGILRMTLNARLDQCSDEAFLMMQAGGIVEMTREIGKLVTTAHKIEQSMSHLLDKNQAMAWVQELLVIISDYVTDPEQLQQLSDRMINSLAQRTTPEGVNPHIR